jgi:alpha-glucosidase
LSFLKRDFSRSISTNNAMMPSAKTSRRLFAVACTVLFVFYASGDAFGQTLARPGWAGSGITTDLWWRHAILYHVNPIDFSPSADASALHGVTQRLDYIHSLGVDALLLTPIQQDAAHAQTLNPALGTLDDLDDLIHEASRRNMRVLLDLDPAISAAELPNVARFWLNRGVAGFHVFGFGDASRMQAATLRKSSASYVGQRILISDAATGAVTASQPVEPEPEARGRHQGHARSKSSSQPTTLDSQSPQLLLDVRPGTVATLSAATIRLAIDASQDILQSGHSLPLLATDGPAFTRSISRYGDGQHDVAIAKIVATLLLTTRGDALLYYGQELGVTTPPAIPLIIWEAPEKTGATTAQPTTAAGSAANEPVQDAESASLLNWYRQLSALHHDNPAVSSGANITLNHDDQNVLVWLRKPQTISTISPVVVILCNLSNKSVTLNLKPDIQSQHLRGSFLRSILRSDGGSGPVHLESIILSSFGVYIGQLRY